jgi:LysR family cys regulon transcriptional activator
MFLRGFMYDFIRFFAPHLTRNVVERAMSARTQDELDSLFGKVELPAY